jgi:hypothetical protein
MRLKATISIYECPLGLHPKTVLCYISLFM